MMYNIVVSNIGTVYQGTRFSEAYKTYQEYKKQSRSQQGYAGGEDVTWFRGGEIYKEFFGINKKENSHDTVSNSCR